ncbi:hypothetical protein ACIQRK_00365 [Streptomyces anulatus]
MSAASVDHPCGHEPEPLVEASIGAEVSLDVDELVRTGRSKS